MQKVGIQLPKALTSTSSPLRKGVTASAAMQKRLGHVMDTPSQRIIVDMKMPSTCIEALDSPPMGGRNSDTRKITRAAALRKSLFFIISP